MEGRAFEKDGAECLARVRLRPAKTQVENQRSDG